MQQFKFDSNLKPHLPEPVATGFETEEPAQK